MYSEVRGGVEFDVIREGYVRTGMVQTYKYTVHLFQLFITIILFEN